MSLAEFAGPERVDIAARAALVASALQGRGRGALKVVKQECRAGAWPLFFAAGACSHADRRSRAWVGGAAWLAL